MHFTGKLLYYLSAAFFILCLLTSCSEQKVLLVFNRTIVKNPPKDTPFVFDNKINVTGDIPKDEKTQLGEDLMNYWDDSLFARKVQKFGFFYTIKNPPLFDTINFIRTRAYMSSYLRSLGYYNTILSNSFHIDTTTNQLRTTVIMDIVPGKKTIIDSLGYDIENTTLQNIALRNAKNTAIIPGKTPFGKQVIASELDRLVSLFRRRGYFLLTRDNLVAEADTTDLALLQKITDPFLQAEAMSAATERRKINPTSIITIRKREDEDSSRNNSDTAFRQYYIGHIYYYPEMNALEDLQPDSLVNDSSSFKKISAQNFTLFYKKGLFNFKPLREHTYMRKGILYNDDNFYKTVNTLSQMGAWQSVDARTVMKADTVDFYYFLYPAKKQNITVDLEASRNTGDFLSSNTLFGLAFNITYRNRNLWKNAIQSSTGLRNGVELSFDKNNPFLQTIQSSVNQTFSFPRFIAPFKITGTAKMEARRTIFTMNASYSDRKDYFRLRSLIGIWAYEWKIKNRIFQWKIPNIELYSLDTLPLLEEAFKSNPYLRTSFYTGYVASTQFTFNITYPNKRNPNTTNYIRASGELAVAPFKALNDKLYQFIKIEGEYRRLMQFRKTSIALRAFAGLGYNYGSGNLGSKLPFYKQYVGGGPNSMRAW